MIKNKDEGNVGWFYIQCPFSDSTGCAQPIIIKGYCMNGVYCVENCSYAWLSAQDNA